MTGHDFISISVMPVDARITPDGQSVDYAEAPERQRDHQPEQVCQLCWAPLTPATMIATCPGPKIPDNIAGLE